MKEPDGRGGKIDSQEERHRERMRRIQAAHREREASVDGTKGLLIVNTGPGKGKSSAAFGMGVRVVGHGLRLGVVQFLKGNRFSGEREILSKLPGVEWHAFGDGFTWDTQDRAADVATARHAWEQARQFLSDPGIAMVILDELCVILAHGYLPVDEVLEALGRRPPMQHAVLTGRGAPQALLDAADLVSRIEAVKHPYKAGIKAQAGVEY